MTYELRTQLKEAGFTLNRKYACKWCGYSPTNRSTWCDLGCGSDYNEMIDIGDKPTLPELINACPKSCPPMNAGHFSLEIINNQWRAGYAADLGLFVSEGGSTPEEAVAKLWLALHQS